MDGASVPEEQQIHPRVRAGDYSPQFGLALGFLLLAAATLGLGLPSSLTGT
jgi:hypothetical protein